MSSELGRGRALSPGSGVLKEFDEFAASADAGTAFTALVAEFGECLVQGSDPTWKKIAARVEDCLRREQAASFIRLGDGEGNLLGLALGEHEALAAHCARNASLLHFGAADVLERAQPTVLPALHDAIRNADIIGFPGPFGPRMLLAREERETYVRPAYGLACTHRYLLRHAGALRLGAKTGAPAGFHRGLLPYYESLIRDREVGLISCHGSLDAGLRHTMGARQVFFHAVPRQAVINDGPLTDTEHWPARYESLLAELDDVRPGGLWLVAAGILGKVYCDAIRAAGGVALDIGHVADMWAGVRSRFSIKNSDIDTWSIV